MQKKKTLSVLPTLNCKLGFKCIDCWLDSYMYMFTSLKTTTVCDTVMQLILYPF